MIRSSSSILSVVNEVKRPSLLVVNSFHIYAKHMILIEDDMNAVKGDQYGVKMVPEGGTVSSTVHNTFENN